MVFSSPLLKGKLIKRYKRFLADIILDEGQEITAHCPNSGAMQGLVEPQTPVWVSVSSNPSRKLPYTWEMAEVKNGTFVGVNTSHPNTLVEDAFHERLIPEFHRYVTLRREVKYGQNSRIDVLLEDEEGKRAYVEVKNVHLKRGTRAAFPSSVTTRGAKHMRELGEMVLQGHKAFIVYIVQRNDCESFEIAKDIDPIYDHETQEALKKGVIPLVYACDVSPNEIKISHPLKKNV